MVFIAIKLKKSVYYTEFWMYSIYLNQHDLRNALHIILETST